MAALELASWETAALSHRLFASSVAQESATPSPARLSPRSSTATPSAWGLAGGGVREEAEEDPQPLPVASGLALAEPACALALVPVMGGAGRGEEEEDALPQDGTSWSVA